MALVFREAVPALRPRFKPISQPGHLNYDMQTSSKVHPFPGAYHKRFVFFFLHIFGWVLCYVFCCCCCFAGQLHPQSSSPFARLFLRSGACEPGLGPGHLQWHLATKWKPSIFRRTVIFETDFLCAFLLPICPRRSFFCFLLRLSEWGLIAYRVCFRFRLVVGCAGGWMETSFEDVSLNSRAQLNKQSEPNEFLRH